MCVCVCVRMCVYAYLSWANFNVTSNDIFDSNGILANHIVILQLSISGVPDLLIHFTYYNELRRKYPQS